LGVNPSSKRKVIKGRYQDNMNALRATLELAKENSSHVLVYIAPLRSDVEIPYIKSEYDSFKNEVQMLTKELHAQFVNFEDLVPADLWGSKGGTTIGEKTELDFMHFQAGGHTLLANEVVKHLIQAKRVTP
jgi:lysophospholipase L1-like esterase